MNLAEHPLALDLQKRIAAADEDHIAAAVLLPGLPQLMGELRMRAPGLFTITSHVNLGNTGQTGLMDFVFCADKAVSVLFPSTHKPEESRIVSPH
jgi:hypothetical protein